MGLPCALRRALGCGPHAVLPRVRVRPHCCVRRRLCDQIADQSCERIQTVRVALPLGEGTIDVGAALT